MTALRAALRKKYKSPQEALKALGLDEALLKSSENPMKKPTRIASIALRYTARGIAPLLAMDKKIDLMPVFEGVNSKNFDAKKLTTSVAALLKGNTIAMDVDIDHVAKMLDHVGAAAKAEPKTADESVSEPQHKAMMAAAEGKSNLGIPKDVGEEFKSADTGKGFDAVMSWAKGKGMSEDDVESLRGMWPDDGAEDEEPDEKEKREKEEAAKKTKEAEDKAAKDAEMKDMVTKPAMDAALKEVAINTAKSVRETERGIRAALVDVAPWVGQLPPTLAFDSAVDVHRHAAEMLAIPNAKTMHAEALWPVIQAQPQPGARRDQRSFNHADQISMGMDEAAKSEAIKIAPGLERITIGV